MSYIAEMVITINPSPDVTITNVMTVTTVMIVTTVTTNRIETSFVTMMVDTTNDTTMAVQRQPPPTPPSRPESPGP
jgi:hypothetical protein